MQVYDANCEYCNEHYVTGDDPTIEDCGLCYTCRDDMEIEYDDELGWVKSN